MSHFTVAPVPSNTPPGLREWLVRHFRLIALSFQAPHPIMVTFDSLAAEPERPEDGMTVYADGTNWNPGSGAGLYCRESGAWVKL